MNNKKHQKQNNKKEKVLRFQQSISVSHKRPTVIIDGVRREVEVIDWSEMELFRNPEPREVEMARIRKIWAENERAEGMNC